MSQVKQGLSSDKADIGKTAIHEGDISEADRANYRLRYGNQRVVYGATIKPAFLDHHSGTNFIDGRPDEMATDVGQSLDT